MALVIEVKVVPSSGKSECMLDKNGALKCFLKSAPEHGKANIELLRLLAKIAQVTVGDVSIVLGLSQRKKTVKITTAMEYKEFIAKIAGDVQQNLFGHE